MKQCKPVSAERLLRRILSGDAATVTCVLCLCEEPLLPPTQAIGLSTGGSVTISQLIEELQIVTMENDLTSKKICTACVDKMLSYYLFVKQCIKTASTLENLVNMVGLETTNASGQFLEADATQESYVGCSLKINVHLDMSAPDMTGKIECSKCSLDFPTIRKLSVHQKEHIRSPYYLCRICDMSFNGYHIFLSHWSGEHPDMSPPVILLQQAKTKTDKPKAKFEETTCSVCEAHFQNRSDFETHQCTHTCVDNEEINEQVMDLEIADGNPADQVFESPTSERTRQSIVVESHIEQGEVKVGLFACGKCSLDFPSIRELSLHLKVHGQAPYHQCTICDTIFNGFSGLLAHYKTLHPEEPSPIQLRPKKHEKFTCSLCNDTFASRRNLEFHVFCKHSENDEKTVCNYCNTVFPKCASKCPTCLSESHDKTVYITDPSHRAMEDSSDDWFESHFRKNDGSSKPLRKRRTKSPRKSQTELIQNVEELRNDAGLFECRKCYSDFETIEELSVHQKEHGKSPYHHCRICDKSFNGFAALLSHYTSVHPDRSLPIPMMSQTLSQFTEKFMCDQCDRSFKNEGYLRFHMFRKHGEAAPENTCNVCNVRYYKSHICRFTCSECPKYPCIHKKYLQAYMNAEEDEPKSKHRCIECDFMYRNKDDLLDHVNKCHLLILPHTCADCGVKWASKKALRMHMACSHPVSKVFCQHCKLAVPKHNLTQHVTECETLEKPFSCELCDGRFVSEAVAETHVKSHLFSGIVCDICYYQCETVDKLKEHMLQCRSLPTNEMQVVPKEKVMNYPCLKCPLDFDSKEESIAHEVSHPLETGYLCRSCETTYATKAEYYECMRTHKGTVTEKCPICGRLFHKLGLSAHMRLHVLRGEVEAPVKTPTGSGLTKNHMCDVCGVMLSTSYELKRHKDRHNARKKCPHCMKLVQKRYIAKHLAMHEGGLKNLKKKLFCKICNYSTRNRDVFEGHLNKVHRQFKPYTCDVCAKKFYSKVHLRCHKSTHTEVELRCEACNQTFRSTKGYELHMMQHRGELPHECDHCNMKFVSASRKKEHQDRVHYGPRHQCVQCDKVFYRGSSLNSHVLVVHQGEKKRRVVKSKVQSMAMDPE